MTSWEWAERYERAYMAANGRRADVVACGCGWYRIATGLQERTKRLRQKQIEMMTATLEARADMTQARGE